MAAGPYMNKRVVLLALGFFGCQVLQELAIEGLLQNQRDDATLSARPCISSLWFCTRSCRSSRWRASSPTLTGCPTRPASAWPRPSRSSSAASSSRSSSAAVPGAPGDGPASGWPGAARALQCKPMCVRALLTRLSGAQSTPGRRRSKGQQGPVAGPRHQRRALAARPGLGAVRPARPTEAAAVAASCPRPVALTAAAAEPL